MTPQTLTTHLQQAGLSVSGANQIAHALLLTDPKDRQRLLKLLTALMAPPGGQAPPAAAGLQSQSGISISFED